jgi:hypothetical protein
VERNYWSEADPLTIDTPEKIAKHEMQWNESLDLIR